MEYKYIQTKFAENEIYTFAMKVKDLLDITYVASRGISEEQGAVQRVLNPRRIDSIKDFILKGNSFVNSFIINWTDKQNLPKVKKETISIPLEGRRAQLLDGQHRAQGLRDAMKQNSKVGEEEVLVSLCIGLNTQEAARIFLNINSEQKPVPKSLIYDLFGEAYDDPEVALTRVTDIVEFLNTDNESPYFHSVKYPGQAKTSGARLIDLSILVNAMKPYFEKDGLFNQMQIRDIEVQKKIILNFYNAIRQAYMEYDRLWEKKENPFFKAAGFAGAFDFLMETLLPRCHQEKKFSVARMLELMNITDSELLKQSDLKNTDGKGSKKTVKAFFNTCYHKGAEQGAGDYEF